MGVFDGLANVNWFGYTSQILYWVMYALLAVIILIAMWFIYYYVTFKYKVTIFPLYGSGKDGMFSFAKPKKNRARWNKEKTAWRMLWPLFNRNEYEPFDSEYIYPGNNIYAFEMNEYLIEGRINLSISEKSTSIPSDTRRQLEQKAIDLLKKHEKVYLLPGQIDVNIEGDKSEKQLRATLNPVPKSIRNWESLQYKKHAIEFAEQTWWQENKALVYGVITIFLCCALCAFTVWITFKFATPNVAKMDMLRNAIENFGRIPAK